MTFVNSHFNYSLQITQIQSSTSFLKFIGPLCIFVYYAHLQVKDIIYSITYVINTFPILLLDF